MSLEAPFPVRGGDAPSTAAPFPQSCALRQLQARGCLYEEVFEKDVCLRRCIAVLHHTHDELKAVVVCFAPEIIKISVLGGQRGDAWGDGAAGHCDVGVMWTWGVLWASCSFAVSARSVPAGQPRAFYEEHFNARAARPRIVREKENCFRS